MNNYEAWSCNTVSRETLAEAANPQIHSVLSKVSEVHVEEIVEFFVNKVSFAKNIKFTIGVCLLYISVAFEKIGMWFKDAIDNVKEFYNRVISYLKRVSVAIFAGIAKMEVIASVKLHRFFHPNYFKAVIAEQKGSFFENAYKKVNEERLSKFIDEHPGYHISAMMKAGPQNEAQFEVIGEGVVLDSETEVIGLPDHDPRKVVRAGAHNIDNYGVVIEHHAMEKAAKLAIKRSAQEAVQEVGRRIIQRSKDLVFLEDLMACVKATDYVKLVES